METSVKDGYWLQMTHKNVIKWPKLTVCVGKNVNWCLEMKPTEFQLYIPFILLSDICELIFFFFCI